MEELKPCPFCGYPAIDAGQIDKQGTLEICCSHCGAMIRELDRKQLVSEWNRRAAPEKTQVPDLLKTVGENLGYILRDINERDKVFLYVKNAQFALSQYIRHAAPENDYAALKAQYDEINRYNISCTKKIDELLAEKLDTDAHLKAISDSLSEQLRRAAPENKEDINHV